jgi:hypothetical protein
VRGRVRVFEELTGRSGRPAGGCAARRLQVASFTSTLCHLCV